MAEYAIVKNNQIVNIVSAEDPSALVPFFPGCDYIERNEVNGYGEPGGDYFEGYLRLRSPYQSWIWKDKRWQAPTDLPDDGNMYTWNEETTSWVIINDGSQ